MRSFFLFIILLITFQTHAQKEEYAIVIHGGAGYITPENLNTVQQEKYRTSLSNALKIGSDILKNGGSSEAAVQSVIVFLENDTLFNAGRGAVLTHDKTISHDASIMTGKDLNSGAIAGTSHIKNPILGATLVKDKSPHVFLSGVGAESFAKTNGLNMVDPKYFILPSRMEQLNSIIKEENKDQGYYLDPKTGNGKFGTVGCVAIDKYGNICAGTSTGGMMNKKNGRIGDTPIIGAGTYANNKSCGVSSTGHGEYFIRVGVSKEISDRMIFGHESLESAAQNTVFQSLEELGGKGGIISLDKDRNIVMKFNTPGMFRAYQKESEKPVIEMFK